MSMPTATADLSRVLAENPGAIIETLAKEHGVSPRDVVEALPPDLRRFGPGDAFVDAMRDIAGWGVVTVIVHTDDGIMEFTGSVPEGQIARDYYNLMGRTGFHGHLRYQRCAGVAFLERPFMGRLSASVLFFNGEGGIMFKVFVGRDEQGALRPEQLVAFRALAERTCGAEYVASK